MLRGAPAGSFGMTTKSGWMTGELFIHVLKHFIDHMNVSLEQPAILILDNHTSHITIEAIDLARNHGLSLLTLPPHCSHRLQPLDVAVYGPLKKFFSLFADAWQTSHPGLPITIYEIAEISCQAYYKSFTQENVISGFKATGIFPFNPEVFGEDAFLPATVSDQPYSNLDKDKKDLQINHTTRNIDSAANLFPSEASQTISEQLSSASCSNQDKSFSNLNSPLTIPELKKKKNSTNRRKISTAIITATPEKLKLQSWLSNKPIKKAQQKRRNKMKKQIHSSSCESDEIISLPSSISDISDILSSDSELNQQKNSTNSLLCSLDDFVVCKVYSKTNLSRYFVGKITSGPDEESDYEIMFLQRSKKIKNGFIYPETADIASVSVNDIVRVLPHPKPMACTKRLSSVLTFDVDLAYI